MLDSPQVSDRIKDWPDRQRRGDAERETIDRASAGSGSPKLVSVDATIDFKNMPNWVKTAVNADGAFKNLKVTRSTQASKAGSGIPDYNTWSYE
jgi:hypothetical protein